jgi:hypothetical protein
VVATWDILRDVQSPKSYTLKQGNRRNTGQAVFLSELIRATIAQALMRTGRIGELGPVLSSQQKRSQGMIRATFGDSQLNVLCIVVRATQQVAVFTQLAPATRELRAKKSLMLVAAMASLNNSAQQQLTNVHREVGTAITINYATNERWIRV